MENDQVTLLERVLQFALERYGTPPEYLWRTAPAYAVLRRTDSRKWYGVVMDVPRARLGLPGQGKVDILNVKCDPILAASLRGEDGFLPAYHMNRDSWLSVQLDGTVGEETLFSLLADSYRLVGQKPPRRLRPPGPAAGWCRPTTAILIWRRPLPSARCWTGSRPPILPQGTRSAFIWARRCLRCGIGAKWFRRTFPAGSRKARCAFAAG